MAKTVLKESVSTEDVSIVSEGLDQKKAERPSLRSIPSDDKADALNQLDLIETNGIALGTILENIIDTLDIGRLTTRMETKVVPGFLDPNQMKSPIDGMSSLGSAASGHNGTTVTVKATVTASFDEVLEKVVMDALTFEERTRRIQAGFSKGEIKSGMEDVEVVLEVLPRNRGSWKMAQDPGPLAR